MTEVTAPVISSILRVCGADGLTSADSGQIGTMTETVFIAALLGPDRSNISSRIPPCPNGTGPSPQHSCFNTRRSTCEASCDIADRERRRRSGGQTLKNPCRDDPMTPSSRTRSWLTLPDDVVRGLVLAARHFPITRRCTTLVLRRRPERATA
jgi:hypothetical protein